jgi:hypothetical protein
MLDAAGDDIHGFIHFIRAWGGLCKIVCENGKLGLGLNGTKCCLLYIFCIHVNIHFIHF